MSDEGPPSVAARRVGFHGGGQVLSLRGSPTSELDDLRKALQDGQERLARGRGRPTAPCSSTSGRSSTCASSPASTASASE